MFGRYTERAQKAMNLAQEEARRLGWDTVDTGHLFLGLIREGNGLAAVALQNVGLDLDDLRAAVERVVGQGSGPPPHDLEFTPRAIRVLTEESIALSRQLGHNYVGTEHILLALLRSAEGVAATALATFGVAPADVRTLLLASVPTSDQTMAADADAGVGDQMTSQVVSMAVAEARTLGDSRLGSEHLLLGILRYGQGRGVELLRDRGVTLEWLRQQLRRRDT